MAFWWVQGCSSSQLEGDLSEYPQKALHSKGFPGRLPGGELRGQGRLGTSLNGLALVGGQAGRRVGG